MNVSVKTDYTSYDYRCISKVYEYLKPFTDFCISNDFPCKEECPFYKLCNTGEYGVLRDFSDYLKNNYDERGTRESEDYPDEEDL